VNTSRRPGPSDDQEPVIHLLREVCGLADEAAERIPDSAVNERLNSVLRRAGCASGDEEVSHAEIVGAARREAEEILAAARRGAAEAAAEAACAEAAASAARCEAGQYQDAALKKAASLVAEARAEARRIVREARQEADRIIWNRVERRVPARQAPRTYSREVRFDSPQLRDIQDLIAELENVNRKLAVPSRTASAGGHADTGSAGMVPPFPTGAASRAVP
jgi:hypothetical protein